MSPYTIYLDGMAEIKINSAIFPFQPITLITCLDRYGLDVKTVAKDIRTAMACSASVTVLHSGPQVAAHGNQMVFVFKLLRGECDLGTLINTIGGTSLLLNR